MFKSLLDFLKSLFISQESNLWITEPRSPHWATVRKAHLAKEPACAICGTTEEVEVHHVKPFHLFPQEELNPDNLVTLCNSRQHHLLFGHLDNFRSYNLHVREDIKTWTDKIKNRP